METPTAPAPVAPAAPAKAPAPATPAIPAAQAKSVTPPAPLATTTPKTPPTPTPTVEQALRKVRDEVFKEEGSISPEAAAKLTETPPTKEPEKKAEKPEPAKAAPAEPAKKEPPVVPADKDPFDHISPPDGMTEKSMTGWKALKKEAAEKVAALAKQHADAVAQLETYKKATPADTAEAARLKAELQQANDRLAVLDLQNHPDFTRQYVEPKKKALTEAKTLMEANSVENQPDFNALMSRPLKEFSATVSELAAKMPAYDQGAFVASMREAYRLQGEERGALSKSGELRAAFEAKAAAQARSAFEESQKDFTSKVPQLEVPEGASEEKAQEIAAYNKARSDALVEAERFSFTKLTERQVADISQQAAALKVVTGHIIPSLQRERDQAVALNKALTAELQSIKDGKKPGTFTENAAPATRQQDRNAKTPDFRAVAQEVGMR